MTGSGNPAGGPAIGRAPGGAPPGFPPGAGLGGMGAGGLAGAGAPAERLPGEHFAAATVFLILGALGLIWVAPELAVGMYPSPHVIAVTHLFTLGFITTTICGALYQLLPVALGAPVRWEWMGHASFAGLVTGIPLFVAGTALLRAPLIHGAIGLVTVGIVLFALNVALTLPRAVRRGLTWWALIAALVFLLSTLVLGATLAINLTTPILVDARRHALALHLHLGTVGWALLVIVGISNHLAPMFLLSHGASTRAGWWSMGLLAAGLVLLAAALLGAGTAVLWLAALVLAAGVAALVVQLRAFHRKRVRRILDVGLRHAALAVPGLVVATLLGLALAALGGDPPRLATLYVACLLLGAIVPFIIGHYYKIVPFLAWLARYGKQVGKERVPRVADMYSARAGRVETWFYFAGALAVLAGIAAGVPLLVRLGGAAIALAALILASQLARAAWGTVA